MTSINLDTCTLYEVNSAFRKLKYFDLPLVAERFRRLDQVSYTLTFALCAIVGLGMSTLPILVIMQSGSVGFTAFAATGGATLGSSLVGLAVITISQKYKDHWMKSKQASEFDGNLFGKYGRSRWLNEQRTSQNTAITITNPHHDDVEPEENQRFSLIHIYDQYSVSNFTLGESESAERIKQFAEKVQQIRKIASTVAVIAAIVLIGAGIVTLVTSRFLPSEHMITSCRMAASCFLSVGIGSPILTFLVAGLADQAKHVMLRGTVQVQELDEIDRRLLDYLHRPESNQINSRS